MKKSEELRAQAAQKLADARKIKDEAEKNGGMNGEKRQQVEHILADMDTILEDAKTEERMEAAAGTVAPEERGRRLPEPVVEEDPEATPEEREAAEMTATPEYREAFLQYARGGEGALEADQRRMLYQARTLVEGTDPQGGYLAPEQLIAGVMREAQDIEQLAPRMETINTNARQIKFTREDETADLSNWGWVAELQQKPEDQPAFEQQTIDVHVGAGVVWVSDELMEDSQFGLEAYLALRAAERKVEIEETAFLAGTGNGQPRGILTAINSATGTPQRFTSTTVGAISGDDFLRILYALPRRHRRNASFVVGSQVMLAARLLKDGNGQYVWQPGLQAGDPDRLVGKPVIESPDLALDNPVAANNDVAIAGDLRRYRVLRRIAMQVKRLDELRALTDEVGFRFRWRTGGDVMRPDAFRTLRIRAA